LAGEQAAFLAGRRFNVFWRFFLPHSSDELAALLAASKPASLWPS